MKSKIIHLSKKSLSYYKTHKAIGSLILIAVFGVGYYTYGKIFSSSGTNQYVLARVTRGDIETTVTGTGQIAATNQIDIQAQASGRVTYIGAVAGQSMKAGQVIAKLDTTDISLSLQSARIALAKLKKPVDQSTLISSQNSLSDAEQQKTKAYEDAKISLSTTYLDIPDVVSNMHDLFYDGSGFLNDKTIASYSSIIRTYRDDAGVLFDASTQDIASAQNTYRANIQTTDPTTIESLLDQTYAAVSKLGDAVKKAKLTTDAIKNTFANGQNSSAATDAQSNIGAWTSKINNHLTDLLAVKTSINSAKRAILQKTESLSETVSGTDALDIQSQELNVRQKEIEYEKYIIRAPFDGVLAKLTIQKGDSVGGSNVGTFITKQKVAEITLNEIDAAKVAIGQPVTLTFDAVDDLTATGTVASIDLIGTVTQGVVNYTAKIAFDTQDERIKPGMSVSATITTSSKKDVLLVPSTAIKTKNGSSYVEVAQYTFASTTSRRTRTASSAFATSTASSTRTRKMFTNQTPITLSTTPTETPVTIGTTNNTQTEILTGLEEGQFVVSKTITSTSTSKTTTTTGSLFNLGGATRATGGQRPPTGIGR